MSTKKMSKAAREYLLTWQKPRPAVVDCWAIQDKPNHPQGVVEVRFFRMAVDRRLWIAESPKMRRAVGKRHPAVKAFRMKHGEALRRGASEFYFSAGAP